MKKMLLIFALSIFGFASAQKGTVLVGGNISYNSDKIDRENAPAKTDAFALRHIGPRENDVDNMLKTIGASSLDQLIDETIPSDIRLKSHLDLAPAMTEYEYSNHITQLGNKNKMFQSDRQYVLQNMQQLLLQLCSYS